MLSGLNGAGGAFRMRGLSSSPLLENATNSRRSWLAWLFFVPRIADESWA